MAIKEIHWDTKAFKDVGNRDARPNGKTTKPSSIPYLEPAKGRE